MRAPAFRISPRRRVMLFFIILAILFIVNQHFSLFRRRRLPPGYPKDRRPFPKPHFTPGVPKPPGSNYTRTLVVPRLKDENVDWIHEEFPDLETAIYVVDDPEAPLHPPKNKGREVMVYLTYIIDHYDNLPEIVIFMHAHRIAWHNEVPLDMDAVEMLRRLSNERVIREGFFNMRCNWAPGCPDWIHPQNRDQDFEKQEEPMVAQAWGEIFPYEPIPETLAQPCCAQFAISRERILAIPKSRYVYYRDWMLLTELSDYISGRIWEYLWQVVFTGEPVYCPLQHVCYCDGFGLCFGGEEAYNDYNTLYWDITHQQQELQEWRNKAQAIEDAKNAGKSQEEIEALEVPEPGRDVWLDSEINRKAGLWFAIRNAALERGKYPENRAREAGRPWKPGDGF
ncbi:hypothetical protein VTO42DRAFT_5246 [Malbranchea cinnamomea]